MESAPDTRASLLIRVRDQADWAAWQEFVEIYRPVIVRFAQLKGMQPMDADDIAQEVLVAVAKAVERREHDPKRAKFRTWLHRVASNIVLDALAHRKRVGATGDSSLQSVLDQKESRGGPDSDLLRLEYRREVFHWAAAQVRKEFRAETWTAFWQTAVEDRSVEDVARELQKDTGAIYTARSRVIRRIQKKVVEYESDS